MTILALAVAALLGLSTAAHADGDVARGEQRFADCAACHSLAPDTTINGPSLAGLLGRQAGTVAGFRYSAAMRRSAITWTAQTLDEFIADPQKLVPANRMPYSGMPDAGERADLIAYLQKAMKPDTK